MLRCGTLRHEAQCDKNTICLFWHFWGAYLLGWSVKGVKRAVRDWLSGRAVGSRRKRQRFRTVIIHYYSFFFASVGGVSWCDCERLYSITWNAREARFYILNSRLEAEFNLYCRQSRVAGICLPLVVNISIWRDSCIASTSRPTSRHRGPQRGRGSKIAKRRDRATIGRAFWARGDGGACRCLWQGGGRARRPRAGANCVFAF